MYMYIYMSCAKCARTKGAFRKLHYLIIYWLIVKYNYKELFVLFLSHSLSLLSPITIIRAVENVVSLFASTSSYSLYLSIYLSNSPSWLLSNFIIFVRNFYLDILPKILLLWKNFLIIRSRKNNGLRFLTLTIIGFDENCLHHSNESSSTPPFNLLLRSALSREFSKLFPLPNGVNGQKLRGAKNQLLFHYNYIHMYICICV